MWVYFNLIKFFYTTGFDMQRVLSLVPGRDVFCRDVRVFCCHKGFTETGMFQCHVVLVLPLETGGPELVSSWLSIGCFVMIL